ncbi:MAG: uroporphyrinogen-III synthase [Bacteroidales bacterium]|nr:uroporphyrinogen-III synthase [Bacteroidales bacterium]
MKIRKVLVSQPEPNNPKSPYFELAKKYNLKIDFRQFILVEGVSAKDFRQQKINITDFTAVVFTSKTAIDHFFRICDEMRITVADTMRYFCITESVAFYLQKYIVYRKRKIFHGRQSFEELVDIIKKHKEEKYLLPCSDIHKVSMSKLLDESGIEYAKAIFYKTLASDLSHIEIGDYDMLIFFSPAGVESLFKNFPEFRQNSTIIGAFGPTTAKAVKDAGLTLNIEAPTKTSPSMTMAIEEYLQKNNKKTK